MKDNLLTEDDLEQATRPTYRQLEWADRCDRCGESTQAFVRAIKVIDDKDYELLFCGHHFNRYQPTLVASGWLIQDERNQINYKPQSGSKYEDIES